MLRKLFGWFFPIKFRMTINYSIQLIELCNELFVNNTIVLFIKSSGVRNDSPYVNGRSRMFIGS